MTQTTRIGQQNNPALLRDTDLGTGSRTVGTGYPLVLQGLQAIIMAIGWDRVATIAAAITARYTALASAPVLLGPTASINDVLTARQGITLTVSEPKVDAIPAATVTYQWDRNGVDIVGATAATYTPVLADVGTVLTRTSTYANGSVNLVITTAGTNAVLAAA